MLTYEELRDKHKSKEAVIVCTGPSINDTDPSLIDRDRFITLSCNTIFKHPTFKPDYWLAEDLNLINLYAQQFRDYKPRIAKLIPAQHHGAVGDCDIISYRWDDVTQRQAPFGFGGETGIMMFGWSVTYIIQQFAWYIGCREIYMLGFDQKQTPPPFGWDGVVPEGYQDPYHFDKDYMPAGIRGFGEPHMNWVWAAHDGARTWIEAHGGHIYNATPDSGYKGYEMVDWHILTASGSKA